MIIWENVGRKVDMVKVLVLKPSSLTAERQEIMSTVGKSTKSTPEYKLSVLKNGDEQIKTIC